MPESPLAAIVGRLVRGLPLTDGTADAGAPGTVRRLAR